MSVSRQSYYAGPLQITEVVIDILGAPSQVRIYNAQMAQALSEAEKLAQSKLPENLKPYAKMPDSVKQRLTDAQSNAAQATSAPQIQKMFPATTNSKTIEFIVPSIEELEEFYTIFSNDFIGNITPEDKLSEAAKTSLKNTAPGIKGKLYKILPPENMKNLYDIFNKKSKK